MALVLLVRVHDMALAEILRGRLESEGLEALLFDDGFAGLLGGYPAVRLMVREGQAGHARRLLDLPENQASLP
jgi:hypothetical protein